MSRFGQVLAGLNLLLVIGVLVLAGASVKRRQDFAKAMDAYKEQLQGIAKPAELLNALPPEVQAKARSLFAQRLEGGKKLFEPIKDKPLSNEVTELTKKLGPDDVKRLVQMQIRLERPKLSDEEVALLARMNMLLNIRERYIKQMADLVEETDRLKQDFAQETKLKQDVLAENIGRQQEIARIYAELEEARAAELLAQGRLKDTQDYFKRTQEQVKALANRNQELAQRIQGKIPR